MTRLFHVEKRATYRWNAGTGCSFQSEFFEHRAKIDICHPKFMKYGSFERKHLGICEYEQKSGKKLFSILKSDDCLKTLLFSWATQYWVPYQSKSNNNQKESILFFNMHRNIEKMLKMTSIFSEAQFCIITRQNLFWFYGAISQHAKNSKIFLPLLFNLKVDFSKLFLQIHKSPSVFSQMSHISWILDDKCRF